MCFSSFLFHTAHSIAIGASLHAALSSFPSSSYSVTHAHKQPEQQEQQEQGMTAEEILVFLSFSVYLFIFYLFIYLFSHTPIQIKSNTKKECTTTRRSTVQKRRGNSTYRTSTTTIVLPYFLDLCFLSFSLCIFPFFPTHFPLSPPPLFSIPLA